MHYTCIQLAAAVAPLELVTTYVYRIYMLPLNIKVSVGLCRNIESLRQKFSLQFSQFHEGER